MVNEVPEKIHEKWILQGQIVQHLLAADMLRSLLETFGSQSQLSGITCDHLPRTFREKFALDDIGL